MGTVAIGKASIWPSKVQQLLVCTMQLLTFGNKDLVAQFPSVLREAKNPHFLVSTLCPFFSIGNECNVS